jgi:hypothetical protein
LNNCFLNNADGYGVDAHAEDDIVSGLCRVGSSTTSSYQPWTTTEKPCAQVYCSAGTTLTGADSLGCGGHCVDDGGGHKCHSYQRDYIVGKSYTKSLEFGTGSLGVDACAQKCLAASQCVAFTFKLEVLDEYGNPGRNSNYLNNCFLNNADGYGEDAHAEGDIISGLCRVGTTTTSTTNTANNGWCAYVDYTYTFGEWMDHGCGKESTRTEMESCTASHYESGVEGKLFSAFYTLSRPLLCFWSPAQTWLS